MEEVERNINDLQYWNGRFQEDWENKGGREQSTFFSAVAFENLPLWIKQYLSKEQPSFCDWGCALGDGTDYLKRSLMLNKVSGIDFSSTAILKAQEKYPEIDFIHADLTTDTFNRKFNIVFSSNTLEHFYEPWETLRKVAGYADQHLILMIPFKEYNLCSEEHFSTFDFQSIPVALNNDFILTHSQVIDTGKKENTSWAGLQILLIYSNANLSFTQKLSLDELTIETAAIYYQLLSHYNLAAKASKTNEQLAAIAEQYSLQAKVQLEKDTLLNDVQKRNEEISKKLSETEQKDIKAEKKLADTVMQMQTANQEAVLLKEQNKVLNETFAASLSAMFQHEKASHEKSIAIHVEELNALKRELLLKLSTITDLQDTLNKNTEKKRKQEEQFDALSLRLNEIQAGNEKLLQELQATKDILDKELAQRFSLEALSETTSQMLEACRQENDEIKSQLSDTVKQQGLLLKKIDDQQNNYSLLHNQHQAVIKSGSWIVTKPLRFICSLFN
jgi:hypothetical protein